MTGEGASKRERAAARPRGARRFSTWKLFPPATVRRSHVGTLQSAVALLLLLGLVLEIARLRPPVSRPSATMAGEEGHFSLDPRAAVLRPRSSPLTSHPSFPRL